MRFILNDALYHYHDQLLIQFICNMSPNIFNGGTLYVDIEDIAINMITTLYRLELHQ